MTIYGICFFGSVQIILIVKFCPIINILTIYIFLNLLQFFIV